MTNKLEIQWILKTFKDLTNLELYTILAARQAIFVVEQNCPFQEADWLDFKAWHLMGIYENELSAYARIVHPEVKFANPSIGRIITTQNVRGKGVGKILMKEAIQHTKILYPGMKMNLSAQIHLEKFYGSFGFKRISEPYDEDGILHIDMERLAD